MVETAPRYCFLMERQVGIGSAAAAIEPYIRKAGHAWCDVTYTEPDGWLERLPLPHRVQGTLRGYVQTTRALDSARHRALLFLTHNPAVFQRRALRATPTLLWTDVTPALLDAQAAQYDHPVDRFRTVGRLKAAIVRSTFHRAARCVGWSEWARRSFVGDYGIPEERTAVIPPGIDLSHWKLPPPRRRAALPRVLFVGGHFERKGGRTLLDVFQAHFRGRCELDLVTRDPVPPEPGVRVHRGLNAKSPELLGLYRDCDVFVLPTRGDCFSIASLEAMAMGLPVVVSDVGGIRDIIEEGASGHLIRPGDGAALRAVLDPLIADEERRARLGTRGRAIVEQRFDAEKTAARLTASLFEIAKG